MVPICLFTKTQLPHSTPPAPIKASYRFSYHFVLLIELSISHSAKSGSLSTSVEPQDCSSLAIFDFVIDIIYNF